MSWICAAGNSAGSPVHLAGNVIRLAAANEQRRFGKRFAPAQDFAQMRIIFRHAAQIDLPEEFSVFIPAEIFQQKPAQIQRWNFRRQRIFNLLPRLKLTSNPAPAARRKFFVRSRIGARRHVRDDQFFHALRKIQRKLHRHFAAHRMADDDRRFQFFAPQKISPRRRP